MGIQMKLPANVLPREVHNTLTFTITDKNTQCSPESNWMQLVFHRKGVLTKNKNGKD